MLRLCWLCLVNPHVPFGIVFFGEVLAIRPEDISIKANRKKWALCVVPKGITVR